MTDAADKLDFCKQALGELGTRSTITSLDPPDGSQEAYYCNLFFNGTRDQVLRAAHWGFAGRTDPGILWKAMPGTPENPVVPIGHRWSNRDPPPPWLYTYQHPAGAAAIRRIRSQPDVQSDLVLPFYSSPGVEYSQRQPVPFEVANDSINAAGNSLIITQTADVLTLVARGTGYRASDIVYLGGGVDAAWGNPVVVYIYDVDSLGAVRAFNWIGTASFTQTTPFILTQLSTTGKGVGFNCTATWQPNPFSIKVINTNAQNPLIDFTTAVVDVAEYDPGFADAFMLALEGKLALALIGDRALYTAKLQEANNSIINARVRDGNEGLTTYDHVPDWLQVRGVASMASAGEWFNPPYGPLFAV